MGDVPDDFGLDWSEISDNDEKLPELNHDTKGVKDYGLPELRLFSIYK